MPTVEVSNLALTFYEKEKANKVLKDISFDVNRGEIVSLLGLSGAGKTSLLRTLNLLQKPDSGRIKINNQEITTLPEEGIRNIRQKIAVVFQHFNLFQNKTVYDNIAFPLALKKEIKSSIKEKVEKIADELHILEKQKAYPSTLSGGEKQRVAIARAMIVNPELLLLDEPTSALDPKTKYKILDTVNRLNKKHNMTTITVTHDMDVVKSLSDKVAYLKRGELLFYGPPHEFFSMLGHELNLEFDLGETISKNFQMTRNSKIIKVFFWGEKASQPILWQLSQTCNVQINIISGNIEDLKHGKYGHLECEIEGENTEKFIEALKSEVYKVEVKNNG